MYLQRMTWPAIEQLPKTTPVVIPIAAVEQHGHHLPLDTDSMLLGEIVRRVEASQADQVLVAPLQWLGNSDHHLDFCGTQSLRPRHYLNLLTSLIDNFIYHGFTRILILNGHGGNDVPGKQAIFETRQTYRQRNDLLLLFTTYWSIGSKPCESNTGLQQTEMGHAGEWETSMMLKIAPELVGNYLETPDIDLNDPFRAVSRGWVTQDRSEPGHIGFPRHATAEKGAALLDLFVNDVQSLLDKLVDEPPR